MSNRPLSICFFAPGKNVHTRRWCSAMAQRGHRVTLVSQDNSNAAVIDGVEVHNAYPTGVVRHIPKIRAIAFANHARNLMDVCEADIFHMHWLAKGVVARKIVNGRHPLVISVWGSDIVSQNGQPRTDGAATRQGLSQADLVCATTRFLCDQTRAYCSAEKRIEVVPFGVNLDLFSPAEEPVTEPIIGFAKHLLPVYGPDVLIRAMKHVVKRVPEAHLKIAGSGEMEPELRQQAKESNLGQVEFCGRVPHEEIPDFFRSCAVAAMPSRQESFGVAAIEAQACGVPVVASNVGGVSEAIDNGRTGVLVPAGDDRALADAIVDLLRDDNRRRAMGRHGREFVAERYDWNQNVDQMEKLYRELV